MGATLSGRANNTYEERKAEREDALRKLKARAEARVDVRKDTIKPRFVNKSIKSNLYAQYVNGPEGSQTKNGTMTYDRIMEIVHHPTDT